MPETRTVPVERTQETTAQPQYARGEVVRYIDHHNRTQIGEVLFIEAKWWGNSKTKEPHICYTLRHPTYANRRMYTSDPNILESVNT